MRRRIFLIVTFLLSVASVAAATFIAAQKAAPQRAKAPAQKSSPAQGASRQRAASQRGAAAQNAPLRPADPNRAPQSAVDDALYTSEEFFGAQSWVMRPYSVALERISALIAQYPKDARLHLRASMLAERLSQFDRAATEMRQYADLKGRSPDALRRLADFYHNRARYSDEVNTLEELAKAVPVNDRSEIYRNAALIVRSRALKQFKPADFFAELVAADPSNAQPVKDYVEELQLANRYDEALAALASFQPKFPSELAYFLKTRAQILEAKGDRRAAEQVYSSAFDPTWPRAVAADYYDLLRRFGRYRVVRRGLQDQARAGAADLQTVARLFSIFAYEGNYEQAARLLAELEQRRAAGASTRVANTGAPAQTNQPPASGQPAPVRAGAWTARELETAAAMFASIGHYDQASRYLYTLYLTGGLQPTSAPREDALYRLFKVMLDATSTPTRVAGGDLSFYRDVAEVDQHPGFMNGVLSLILADTQPAQQFANQEQAAAGYFNRAFAYRIFTAFKQEYPQSARLGEMYLGVVNAFSALGEHRLAIQAGREFQQQFPNSPSYAEVSLRIADAYVALKDRASERAALAQLLERLARTRPKGTPLLPVAQKRWRYGVTPQEAQLIDRINYTIEAYSDTYDPTDQNALLDEDAFQGDQSESTSGETSSDARRPNYSSVLERYVASLAAEDKKTDTVAFFWNEIKKRPKEEGLYERFLRWLGQAQLVNEQLKAYNTAIREFDSNTWYHRLARWYVREKRGREMTRYSRQLIDIFDEDEITEYLLRFAGYGTAAGADELNWDQRLAFDLYSYAHKRFPQNLFFVRGMLTYLARPNRAPSERAQWEQLAAQYYFADRSIRDPYLEWLSAQKQLRDRYRQAKSQSAAAPDTHLTYQVFAADAALWLSHYDEAIDAYRKLVSLYPGEPQYADRLADLTRSLGQQSDKFYEESAQALTQMAEIYPADHSYRIKAGEVYAQLGDFKRAGEQWDKLIQLEPGDRETYLEVATVYWDYYQYDQAVRVFKDLRDVTGDQTIYAYRLGAVYEAKGDMDSAIAEYVKVLSEPGEGRDTASKRLAQLSRRAGLAEKIAATYERARAVNPGDWQLVIGYANYQAERDHQADALALLRSEVEKSSDVAFLESVRDLFRSVLRPEDEQKVIGRLVAVARDEREAMMYQLQLASFLERHGKIDDAINVIDRLVAAYPTNVGVIEESAKFYWRAGLLDRSIDLYKRTLARARGSNRRALILQLARRQSDAGRLADAEATLRAYYNEDRSDMTVFSELARALGAENKLAELAELYQSAFKDVRESGLGGEEAKARTVELRAGMIRALDSLGKFQDALDQHIEIVNAFPEDENRLAAAIDYAERHSLMDRLTAYYEKLTKESYKNYRWQLVLGRIYERVGNLAGATEQYRAAVANEPQRADLRFTLASSLARQKRYDEAIATLREGWTLAGRDPQWLVEVARIQIQQGKRDEAVQTIRQALAAKKNQTARAQLQAASQLAGWGLDAEAIRIYEQALAALPKTLKDEVVEPGDVTGYVRALVRAEPAASAFQKIERLRGQYQAIADNSQDTDGYKARSIVSWLDDAMRTDFGRGVIDYATANETAALASSIRSSTAKLTTYADREPLLRYLGIARGANLVEVEEQIHTQLKDAAFKARTQPEDSAYYSELRALIAFYNRHAAFARAAEALAAEYARDPYKDRFDQNQIAIQYRLAGDRARELDSLRLAYASVSGDLTTNQNDVVERYLSLLYSSGMRNELERLASSYSPHQLQLINFLIDKNEKALARTAIANAKKSPAWVASRSGEVGLFLKDTSPETGAFFRAALDIRPIGELLSRRPDPSQSLIGNDWFIAARNYGFWLGLGATERDARQSESRNYVVGEIESHPSSARAQLELAAYYLDQKNVTRAIDHTSLAVELAPGSKETAVMRGAVALARGDRKAALDAWATLISGRVTIADAQLYLNTMADNGFLREALPQLENFIVAYVNRPARGSEEEPRTESIKPLVREIANRASRDTRLANDAAAAFQSAITRMPQDLTVGRMLIEESLLPEPALAGIYRSAHQRLSDIAAAAFGTSEYENGYWAGADYIYPARALSDWRKRFIDYLIRTRALDEARLLVATIEQEQSDLALATEQSEGESASEDRYDWLPLASALIDLRGGRDVSSAVAKLRGYCGLKGDATKEGEAFPSHERCLKAYALLVAEGRGAEADALLYDSYQEAVRARHPDAASLAGLAEMEARRGRNEEAGRLLNLLAENSTQLAAETAARVGRFSDAIEFREQIARANPNDAINRLELARALAAAGRAGEAIDRIAALLAERGTPNTVRAQAAEVVAEITRADRSQSQRAAAFFDPRAAQADAGAALASAAIAEASGQTEKARAALARVSAGPLAAVAQMKLGLLALAAGRDAEATSNFERAVYLDADGDLTGAIAFRAPSPRAQLILLYGKNGRDLAAMRLAEGDESSERSLISAAVRNALASGSERAANANIAFEPSLDAARATAAGLKSLAELNQAAAASEQSALLASLVESAARLGQYDKAIAIERMRASEAARAEDRAAIEKRLAEIITAEAQLRARASALLRIDRSNTTESIYAARIIGER